MKQTLFVFCFLVLGACAAQKTAISVDTSKQSLRPMNVGRPMTRARAKSLGASAMFWPATVPVAASHYDAPVAGTVSTEVTSPTPSPSPTSEAKL